MKEKLLISRCLLGDNCKYNGGNNLIDKIDILKEYYELIPVCPENDGGLSTPRAPSEIQGQKVIDKNGKDNTTFFEKGASIALITCQKKHIKKALLKSKSPSCGSGQIYDGSFSSTVISGDGIAARLLKNNGVQVYTDNEIDTLISEAKKKKTNRKIFTVQKMTSIGIFSALTFVITFFLQIPIHSGAGYLNLSDLVIIMSSILIDPLSGMIVGIIGAGLADLLSGYAIYAPFTIVIKALEAFIAGFFFKKTEHWFRYTFIFIGGLMNPLLYMIPDFIFYGKAGLIGSLPWNTIQGVACSIVAIAVIITIYKTNLKKVFRL